MKTSIFLKSYDGDFAWLDYAVRSCEKFAHGFTEIVLAIPEGQSFHHESARTVHIRELAECDHYLFQQITKVYADALTDAEAILFTDSDCIFTRPVAPCLYSTDGRVNWMITPYAKTDTPWKPMIEKFLGRPVEFETMRRHPQMVPRWLLIAMRKFCEQQHGMTLDKYVMSQPYREFSEFNALGAFAYYFHRDRINWINTEEVPAEQWPPLTVLQKYSHGGLTDEVKAEFETILSGGVESYETRDALMHDKPDQPGITSGSSAPPAQTLSATHANGETLRATLPQQTPWENKSDSLAEIKSLAGRLKNFATKPPQVRAVRQALHDAGVIQLAYRFKKRKGWRGKK